MKNIAQYCGWPRKLDRRTIAEIAGAYNVYPKQVMQWKKHLIDGANEIFAMKAEKKAAERSYTFQNEARFG